MRERHSRAPDKRRSIRYARRGGNGDDEYGRRSLGLRACSRRPRKAATTESGEHGRGVAPLIAGSSLLAFDVSGCDSVAKVGVDHVGSRVQSSAAPCAGVWPLRERSRAVVAIMSAGLPTAAHALFCFDWLQADCLDKGGEAATPAPCSDSGPCSRWHHGFSCLLVIMSLYVRLDHSNGALLVRGAARMCSNGGGSSGLLSLPAPRETRGSACKNFAGHVCLALIASRMR